MTFQKEVCKILKMGAKWSLWGPFPAPGPTIKLRGEATSSPGRARLLLEETSSLSGRAAVAQSVKFRNIPEAEEGMVV